MLLLIVCKLCNSVLASNSFQFAEFLTNFWCTSPRKWRSSSLKLTLQFSQNPDTFFLAHSFLRNSSFTRKDSTRLSPAPPMLKRFRCFNDFLWSLKGDVPAYPSRLILGQVFSSRKEGLACRRVLSSLMKGAARSCCCGRTNEEVVVTADVLWLADVWLLCRLWLLDSEHILPYLALNLSSHARVLFRAHIWQPSFFAVSITSPPGILSALALPTILSTRERTFWRLSPWKKRKS